MDENYWENYYKSHRNPTASSSFAIFCTKYIQNSKTLVELGCGNGRDSVFLSREEISARDLLFTKKMLKYPHAKKTKNKRNRFLSYNKSWS